MDPLLLPVVQMPNFQRSIYDTLYQSQRGMRRHMQSTITPQADIGSLPSGETTLRRYSISQMAEQTALRYATSAALLLGIIVVGANLQRNPVPMFEDWRGFGSLFFFWNVPVTLVVAAITYRAGIKAWNAQAPATHQRKWGASIIPVALAYTLVVTAMTVIGLQFAEAAFRNLALARLTAGVLVGLVGGALIFWLVRQVMQMSTSKLLTATVLIIGGGVYLTAATIDNPLWWQVSFSYLGTMKSSSRAIFNLTLIFGGVLFLVWLPYFMTDLEVLIAQGQAPERSRHWLRLALLALGTGIALVGFFKSGLTPFSSLMHNIAAYSLAGIFAALMLFVRRLVPSISREVRVTSWVLVGTLVGTLGLAAVGYFNTVGLEVIAFALGITWLQMFTNAVHSEALHLAPDAYPG